jgi:uncharacterized protein (DUF1330 family)
MTAYLIANLDIHDPDTFARYREQVTPLIAKFGGRYLIRGGDVQTKEGDLGLKRLVVLEFPDMKAAEAFYGSPEYQPIMQLRLRSATSALVLVSGYDGAV